MDHTTEKNTISEKCTDLANQLKAKHAEEILKRQEIKNLKIRLQAKYAEEKLKGREIADLSKQLEATHVEKKILRQEAKDLAIQLNAKHAEEKLKRQEAAIRLKARRVEEKLKRRDERIIAMSPERRQAYLDRESRREYIKTLPREEQIKLKEEKKAASESAKQDRIKAKEARTKTFLEGLTSERRLIMIKKMEDRDALNKLPIEERQIIRDQKRAEMVKRREQFQYLAENWSLEIPDDLQLLVVDGNNLRGGGPRRSSRDEVLEIIEMVAGCLHPLEIICVFDHTPSPYTAPDHIKVIFSIDVTADDVIAEMTKTDKNSLVVTSDRGLALRVLANGKKVMRASNFLCLAL